MISPNNQAEAERDVVKIRPLRAEDILVLKNIDHMITQRATTWDNVDVYLAGTPLLSFVAELDGEVIGFLLGDVKSYEFGIAQSAWLETMGVKPAQQRSGVGGMLVKAFLDHCRRSGIRTVQVLVKQDDAGLQGFLQNKGFHQGALVNYELTL